MNVEKLDEIVALSSHVRYVGVIDPTGKVIERKMRHDVEGQPDSAEYLHLDSMQIRNIVNIQEPRLGKCYALLTSRESIHEYTIFAENYFLYVTFDLIRLSDVAKLAEKVQQLSLELFENVTA